MAANLQMFTSSYYIRRFAACGCWTQTSWQELQRDSDMLIAVSRDAGERRHWPLTFKRGTTGMEGVFIDNFMVTLIGNRGWSTRTVTRRAKQPIENFSPPWKHVLDIYLKYWANFKKSELPSGNFRPSWCPKLVTGLWSTTQGLPFLLISHTLKNVRNLCFNDFSWLSGTNRMVPELFCKNIPESLYIGHVGTVLPRVTWCGANFGHHTS